MRLSVAYSFEPGLIEKLSAFPEVAEVYAKLDRDLIGGGRSTYTLRPAGFGSLRRAIADCRRHGIGFNYLLNAASLDGSEQTRAGQRRIRRFIEKLGSEGIESATVASPLLLKIIKKDFPQIKVRIGVFARIDTPAMARQWEAMGADSLCISAVACNRNFEMLAAIRGAVSCDLQLLVNASCLPQCAHELTHMNLLTQSSRSGHQLGGFCLDYCFLHCSRARLQDPVNSLRSVWIRPEDLPRYEAMGYTSFKIVERSCPGWLLLNRVRAYASRSFEGNLMELVAQVAQIKPELEPSKRQYLRLLFTLGNLRHAPASSLLKLKRYAEAVMPHDFSREGSAVYIDNRRLDGFLDGLASRNCALGCAGCTYCEEWTRKAVTVNPQALAFNRAAAEELEELISSGKFWKV